MIQANEVRVDNWVLSTMTKKPIQIDWLAIKHLWDGNIQSVYNPEVSVYEPIPLSAEILEKCGFKWVKPNNGDGFWIHNEHRIEINERQSFHWGIKIKHLQFLHDIQNAWPVLTNTELSITPMNPQTFSL